MNNSFTTIYKAEILPHRTVTQNGTVTVNAHGINIENLGNTIAKISGFNPIEPNGYLILQNYSNPLIYRGQFFIIEFDETKLKEGETPHNKLVIHVDKIHGFPYPS